MNDEYEIEVSVIVKKNGQAVSSGICSKKLNYEIIDEDLKLPVDDFKFLAENYDFDKRVTHSKSEYWSVDYHVMEDILFNIPRLQNGHSYPSHYSEDATKLHAEGKFSEMSNGDLAFKLWHDELDGLAKLIRLYMLYSDFCIFDENDTEMKKVYDERLAMNEIPGKDDFKKFEEFSKKYWNAWIEKFKEIGQEMWD